MMLFLAMAELWGVSVVCKVGHWAELASFCTKAWASASRLPENSYQAEHVSSNINQLSCLIANKHPSLPSIGWPQSWAIDTFYRAYLSLWPGQGLYPTKRWEEIFFEHKCYVHLWYKLMWGHLLKIGDCQNCKSIQMIRFCLHVSLLDLTRKHKNLTSGTQP